MEQHNNEAAQENRINGIVKWFSGQKAYGFITDPENKRDYFCHYSDIISDADYKILHEGQSVSFETEKTPKGLKAIKIKVNLTPQESLQAFKSFQEFLANSATSGAENETTE